MITKSKNLSLEEKVNLIFDFLFNNKKHMDEEKFWNSLSKKELSELKKIKKESSVNFQELKSSL